MIISFESRKKSYPAFFLLIAYAALALFFKDRLTYVCGIALALILFLGSYGIGKRLSFLVFKTADQTLYLPLGLGVTLAITYAGAAFSTNPALFYCIWGALALLAIFEFPVLNYRLGRSYFWTAPFVLLAFWVALSPPTSFDALSTYVGLPHQYLARGKMTFLTGNVFSAFPPFSHVLNLLFAGIGFENGIKPFLIVIYFQTVFILVALLRWLITEPVMSGPDRNDEYQVDLMYMSRTEFMVVPMMLLPSAWIAVQLLSPELLAGMFFCAGISTLVKEFEFLTGRKMFNAAVLLSFALWTKYSILIYLLLLPLLWLLLSRWRFPRENAKALGLILGVVLLLWSPFLIRNAMQTGDPFYPLLSGILKDPGWSVRQSVALVRDFMRVETPGVAQILVTPFQFAMQPDLHGPAAATGFLPVLSLILYPFGRRFRTVTRILCFTLFCYVAWIFIFQRFLDLYAPFLFVFLASYFAFRYLYLRSRKLLLASWIACGLISALFLYSFFSRQSLPILPSQDSREYLRARVETFSIAEELQRQMEGKTLLLGESRIAYFRRPVEAFSPYDRNAVLDTLRSATKEEEIVHQLRNGRFRFVVFNPEDLRTLSAAKEVWQFSPEKIATISAALEKSARVIKRSGGVTLYEMKDTGW